VHVLAGDGLSVSVHAVDRAVRGRCCGGDGGDAEGGEAMKAVDLIEALQIITRSQPETEINVGHDTIYIGDYGAKMPKADRKALKDIGWSEMEDAWGHFV
jgi:hypothetical protein